MTNTAVTTADMLALAEGSTAPDLVLGNDAEAAALIERIDAAQAAGVPDDYSNQPSSPNDQTAFEDAVYAKLDELRQLHADNAKSDSREKKELDKSTQKRLREFLAKGYPQALELIRPENRGFLDKLLKDHDMEPGHSGAKLFGQIANLQMGNRDNEKRLWKTPARRNERVGLLYRIFNDWKWDGTGIAQRIIDHNGTTKIIEQDKDLRVDPQAEKRAAQRAITVRNHEGDTVLTPMSGVTVANSGEWRLALVSVHDGGVRVRSLIGKLDDNAILRERDKFCEDEFTHLKADALFSGQAQPDAA